MADSLNTRIAALQYWLNSKGADPKLVVDGVGGPATRRAIIETFRNTAAERIAPADINQFAARLGCSPTQFAVAAEVESGGSGWDSKGLLTCLWERHYLWRRVKLAIPLLSDPKPGGYTVDADGDGINDSWEKLADASIKFAFGVAAECASFGKFQIMGAWWQKLGYPSVGDFIWGLSRSEKAHYEAFCRYVEVNGLKDALRRIDGTASHCTPFAVGYNGAGQKGYDERLAAAYRRMK